MEFINTLLNSFDVFLLILSRILGIFLTAPFFNRREIPFNVKAAFSILISYIMLPLLAGSIQIDGMFLEVLFLAIKEFAMGMIIGISCQMIFNIFFSAGALTDIQMGLSMAQEVDPSSGSQVTNVGSFFNAFAFLLFFTSDAHYIFIRGLINSFELLPLGNGNLYTSNFFTFIIEVMLYVLSASLQLIMPIMIVLFLGNILLAFMAKTMPQMNVFIVGMPFKILIGYFALVILLPHMKELFINVFEKMIENMYIIMRILNNSL